VSWTSARPGTYRPPACIRTITPWCSVLASTATWNIARRCSSAQFFGKADLELSEAALSLGALGQGILDSVQIAEAHAELGPNITLETVQAVELLLPNHADSGLSEVVWPATQ